MKTIRMNISTRTHTHTHTNKHIYTNIHILCEYVREREYKLQSDAKMILQEKYRTVLYSTKNKGSS